MENNKEAAKEKKRIVKLLKDGGVSERRLSALAPIIEHTSWMKVKLDSTIEAIKQSQVAIAYDNGGGQKGIRENPLFKGYEGLWRSYMAGMKEILAALPEEQAKEEEEKIEEPRNVLELVRSKHKLNA